MPSNRPAPTTPASIWVRTMAGVLSGCALWLSCHLACARLTAQSPAPSVETRDGSLLSPAAELLERGALLLALEDPIGAWRAYRAVGGDGTQVVDRSVGLGSAHLMLGHSGFAIAYGEQAVVAAPTRQDAMALTVRAMIKGRRFSDAVSRSRRYLGRVGIPGADLLAARGSALFRVQRTSDAASAYRRVVGLDNDHAEAHLRLGSGLLDPVRVEITPELRLAVGAMSIGERARAIELLQRVLRDQSGNPIAHRLLGEALYAERTAASMAMQDEAFQRLRAAMPRPATNRLPIAAFVPGYKSLDRSRRAVIEATCAMFASHLAKLVAVGGRHDLLLELERTTDKKARSNLRGRRTFDGRVWDDVRGIGGIRAATGIEALDEAATFGFDTFAHEVAHQVHFFTFTPLQRARIKSLYRNAMANRLCLDYYAASNEGEYFGQGVEAFISLAKRPGGETTHGHTRFELKELDPALHDFIAELVSFDALADPNNRERLLAAAVAVGIRCGRCEDAVVAARMMSPGALREESLLAAEQAKRAQRSH